MREGEKKQTLMEDEAGVAFVEYIVISLFITILASAAILVLGIPLLRMYDWGVSWILIPVP
ncbi:MAG: hypothetical protein JJ863_07575 [Deltaproteobacteria bacterium]|nr:hypothetical protein [Deltaproteobacteria bacterium]